jgi:hypothetical protein
MGTHSRAAAAAGLRRATALAEYRRYRPTYPAARIDFVASRCVDHRVAVEGCPSQLVRAASHERVQYVAAHWFDHERCHAECRRVRWPVHLRPGRA